MDVDTHWLKFLLCDSLFIPVYSLISSARRHLAFFLPLTLLLFFLSLSFFLAILFRMNNIFFPSRIGSTQCSDVVVAVLPNSKLKFSHVSFCSVDFISLYCSAHRTGMHGCGGAGTLTVIPYHQFRFIFEL